MLTRATILFVCLAIGAGVTARAQRSEPVPIRTSFGLFPMRIDDWRGVREPRLAPAILAVLGVNDYLTRTYVDASRIGVGLYVGYYESQRQGDTIHSPLNCLPGAGWTPISQRITHVRVRSGAPHEPIQDIAINRYLVQKGLDTALVLYWYQAHGRVTASEYWSRYYMVRDAVRLNRTDGSLVRVIVPVGTDSPDGEARAEASAVRFVKAAFPILSQYLPG